MYRPTVRGVKRNYTQLNRTVFNGELPPSSEVVFEVKCGLPTDWWAYCEYKDKQFYIKLRPNYTNRKFFITILAHEMVHVWEQINYSRMTHGPRFFEMKEAFAEHGLDLFTGYDDKQFI
jgi:hypothetical protein